jgi:RHS repeat-associated protein
VYSTATLNSEVDMELDAFGNRIEEDVYAGGMGPPTTTRFAYDGWNPHKAGAIGTSGFDVWADLNGDSTLQTRYLHGDGVNQVFAAIKWNTVTSTATPYWLLTDRLGSVHEWTDNSTGSIVATDTYDAWGNLIVGSVGRAFGFAGMEWDPNVNLYEDRARYYDPTVGRFTSEDPWGVIGSDVNQYRYGRNDPTAFTDPSGDRGGWMGLLCSLNFRPVPDIRRPDGTYDASQYTQLMVPSPFGPQPSLGSRVWGFVTYYGGAIGQGLKQGALSELQGFAEAGMNTLDALAHPLATLDKLGTLGANFINDPNGTFMGILNSMADAWNKDPSKFCGSVAFNCLFGAATAEAGASLPNITIPAPAQVVLNGGRSLAVAPGAVITVSAAPVVEASGLFGILGGQVQAQAPRGGGGAGNLKPINPQAEGIDAEALKADYAFGNAGEFNLAKDADGNIVLVPVRPGTHPNIPTEPPLSVAEAAALYPLE